MVEYTLAIGDECPEALFRFRYEVYVEELHRPQSYACHKTRRIIDPLDRRAHNLMAWRDGEIIGCVRTNFVRDGGVGSYHDFYELDRLSEKDVIDASICTRYMVAPKYRRSRVPIELMKRIYKYGLYDGIRFNFIDTNAPYQKFYEKFGYEHLFDKTHSDYGKVSIMRLKADDLKWLRSVKSPFAATCAAYHETKKALVPA
jgi:GNAT superfamily N-acetyltransferase